MKIKNSFYRRNVASAKFFPNNLYNFFSRLESSFLSILEMSINVQPVKLYVIVKDRRFNSRFPPYRDT